MSTIAPSPGLDFESRPRREVPAPLRSDVAGFIGRSRRGPVGLPTRVEGWRGFLREFGGLDDALPFPRAVRGYFHNGGEIAWIVRAEPARSPTWSASWDPGLAVPAGAGTVSVTRSSAYMIHATSPGPWAEGLQVDITYERESADGTPRFHFTITATNEPIEHVRDLDPAITEEDERLGVGLTMESRIAAESRLIRVVRDGDSMPIEVTSAPRSRQWSTIVLQNPDVTALATLTPKDVAQSYVECADRLGDVPEVAIVAVPGIYDDLEADDRSVVLDKLVLDAMTHQDRIVVLDPPPCEEALLAMARRGTASADPGGRLRNEIDELLAGTSETSRAIAFVDDLRVRWPSRSERRSTAVYHPWLWVGAETGTGEALIPVAPSGHVAGVISRTDRDRGPHHTPANTDLLDAADVLTIVPRDERGRFNEAGVNLLRCRSGRGLVVWGGRTLDRTPEGMFLAPRRLIHRLVRLIRRVAEPIVFDVNRQELWLVLVRSITTVLLETYRLGGLKGDTPEEAFRVRCDATLNPPEARENGRVLCEIDLAPAVPMEFITIRVAVGESGELEVFDT